jgi:flagellar protein FliO/FliZ
VNVKKPSIDMMKRTLKHISLILLVVLSPICWAAEATISEPGIGAGQVMTVLGGLAFVLALVFGCGWLVKRFSGMTSTRGGAIKVVSVLPVGTRERLALVEVGGQQLLLGVTAQQITTLHTFDEPVVDATETKNNSEFAQKLHQMMSRS